jgi:formate hydrogenlyase subunit 6/NADH:ubiquinone oxidoreductase subunit I
MLNKAKGPGKMLSLIFPTLFKKPATILYPFEQREVEANFRGKLVFDQSKCIGCKICVRDCPSLAIEIFRVSETEKIFKAVVRLDRCIYCGQCTDVCPKGALAQTKEFALANFNREALKVDI